MGAKFPKIVASALIEKNQKYLLTKEILEDGKEYWIIPGGKIEFGENMIDTVKREIKEEINLDIDEIKFLDFKEAVYTNHNYHTIIFFFSAKPQSEKIILDEKILDAKFFSKDEMKELNLVETARWLLDKQKIL